MTSATRDRGIRASQVDRIADQVSTLLLNPRGLRWTSLAACVLDAVWSIGARYDSVVVPLVRRVVEPSADGPLVMASPVGDTYGLARFLVKFTDEATLTGAARNRQRTSTRNGITKAQAALDYARILVDHDVDDLPAVTRAITNPEQFSRVDRALSRVPGEGRYGIRRGYFWMLCGDDHRIKPDRMVLRWLAPHGVHDPSSAQQVLADVAHLLSERAGTATARVTPRQVDHAIWLAARRSGVA